MRHATTPKGTSQALGNYMRKFGAFIATLIGATWSIAAHASPVTVYTDRTQYETALAALPTLTSHDVSLSGFVNPPALNFTSSSNTNPVNVITNLFGTFLSNQQNFLTDTLDLAPSTDVRGVAFDYLLGVPPSPYSITGTLFVNGTAAASKTNSPASAGTALQFFGVISDSAIASIALQRIATWSPNSEQLEFINNISYATTAATTPVPATLPLFISAMGGLGWIGCRRRRAPAVA